MDLKHRKYAQAASIDVFDDVWTYPGVFPFIVVSLANVAGKVIQKNLWNTTLDLWHADMVYTSWLNSVKPFAN